MLLKKKISELEQALDQAQTYTEWEQVGSELDALNGMDLWKIDNASPDYNYELIRDQLQTLRGYMNEKRIEPLMRLLRVGLNHDLGNMGNSNLYGRAHVGTKKLIEDYVDQVCTCLEYICNAQIDGITFGDKLDFFKDTRRSFGQPALMLSGGATLGLFHIGVTKALHEQGLLPKVISGSSAGAIMAAMVGSHTDAELEAMYDGDDWYSDAWRFNGFLNGITGKGFAQQKQLETFLRRNIGEYTFEEAFERTGRHVNIAVSPVHQHQKPRLMNELTSPYLLMWSTVLASSAVPILFPPVTLTAKDSDGHYSPYMPLQKWVDGSMKSDLPRQRLMRMYNVNYFIAVQVNPHIVPFMVSDQKRRATNLISWPRRALREEIKFHAAGTFDFLRSQVSNEMGHQLLDHAYNVVAQRYYGNVTIKPRYTLEHYQHMLRNPNKERWNWFRLQGERATWPKIAIIRAHSRISQTMTECIDKLKLQRQRRQEGKAPALKVVRK